MEERQRERKNRGRKKKKDEDGQEKATLSKKEEGRLLVEYRWRAR
jgi:hypothetical protein